jgi:beta-1,4-mannosyl-glycoprotein beta-1,4-N-acetylglucosaminyltransferase
MLYQIICLEHDEMTKIIDCFLFFQELDLLEIRLSYLDPHVDVFIIVEACQTFTGKKKPFLFEKHKSRYEKFSKKIVYFKITDFHENYDSVVSYLEKINSIASNRILKNMESFDHFPKDKLHWVLDAYHKECMQFPLEELAEDTDTVIFSDLDEIPSNDIFCHGNKSLILDGPVLCIQQEFSYFLNLHRLNRKWFGSIFGSKVKMFSMNALRLDAQKSRLLISDVVDHGGYHFTSVGSIDDIRKKIESWGHQEFNTPRVKNNLERRIQSGRDPFGRESGIIFDRVDPNNTSFFDKKMNGIINYYPDLIAPKDIRFKRSGVLENLLDGLLNFFDKLIYKIKQKL